MTPTSKHALYLTALSHLTPRQRAIYDEYGDMMERLPVKRNAMAKQLKSSVNTVGPVIKFVATWGGPGTWVGKSVEGPPDDAGFHIIIPDTHVTPADAFNGYNRIKRLGEYVARTARAARKRHPNAPIRVICLGDWGDFASLSSWDYEKFDFSQESLERDLESFEVSLSMLTDAIKGVGGASLHFCQGNHEGRFYRGLAMAKTRPVFQGYTGPNIIAERLGWRVSKYMIPQTLEGVNYAHCLPTGNSGRPIGGENASRMLMQKHFVSCVVGHSHLWDISIRTRPDGTKLFGLVAGVYQEEQPEFARNSCHLWTSGITVLRGVKNGGLVRGHSFIPASEMRETVGF